MRPVQLVVRMSRKYMHLHSGHGRWAWLRWPTKYTICDACRPCHLILSILRPIFAESTDSFRLQLDQLPRYQDLAIFVSNDNRTDCFIPCTCVRGKNIAKVSCYMVIHRHNIQGTTIILHFLLLY